ncbi:hypothetical protein [Pseudoalteromonas sp. McH1-42]|uniref:hypothetical protein n=1 Tax=Pseudoalteromonas sp. McH1-42 TaxID=2917752 RepID=UPI001EF52AD0|nr:hypothetical protein [Pseudoalteromonas sp. McH1-42]MCG7562770.1 hypothetical protein [Pseudoalteromonas sp. McH1-42]
MEDYYNVQYGFSFLYIICLVIFIALFIIKTSTITSYFLFAISVTIAVNFYSLSITIANSTISWKMGIGFISGTVDIEQIEHVDSVTNPWYSGWGIREISNGKLYNVSGFEAVHITLKNGKNIRLGTNEPDKLQSAIQNQLPQ